MKFFKVSKTDLSMDGKYYPEGSTHEFDEKSKVIKSLVKSGNLVEDIELAKKLVREETDAKKKADDEKVKAKAAGKQEGK